MNTKDLTRDKLQEMETGNNISDSVLYLDQRAFSGLTLTNFSAYDMYYILFIASVWDQLRMNLPYERSWGILVAAYAWGTNPVWSIDRPSI